MLAGATFIESIKVIAKMPLFGDLFKPNGRHIPSVEDEEREETKRIVRERLFTALHPS